MRIKDIFSFKKKEKVPFSKELIKENLLEANSILRKLNIKTWLTDGTLLGYYRDGDLIDHDLDADLGCFIEDYSPNIIPEFKKRGWSLAHVFGAKNCGLEISFSKNCVKVDIFFFNKETDGRLWHGNWKVDDNNIFNLIKYYYHPFELKEVEFFGSEFFIPKDTLSYVVAKYGSGWEIPQKVWHWATSPENKASTDIYLKKNKKKKVYETTKKLQIKIIQ